MLKLKEGLSPSYIKQVENIVDFIEEEEIEDEIIRRFPNYTAHDMGHFEQVAKNLGTLCEKIELSEQERFCLLAASYAHDLGMALSEPALVEYYENRSQARKKHAERSALMVNNELARKIKDAAMREVIARICEGHGRNNLESPYFNDLHNVRVRLLTCLLMFADSLDLRNERRRPMRNFTTHDKLMGYLFLSEDKLHDIRIEKKAEFGHLSRLHWLRHYYSTLPSINQIVSPFPSIEVTFMGTVGVEKDENEKPIYINNNKFLPDRRLALIEEIILSDPLETYELIKPHVRNFLNIHIKNLSSSDTPVLEARCDPAKILFPGELVKTAFSADMIRSRDISLKDRNQYRKVRIEPFFCEDEMQVSISWKITTLLPTSISKKANTIDRKHYKWVQAVARETWDIVLWRIEKYIEFIQDMLNNGDTKLKEIMDRIDALVLGPKRILNGELKKVFLYHRAADYPLTTTKNISKHAVYDPVTGKLSKEDLYGKILIGGKEQQYLFLSICKKIADNLKFSCEEKVAPEFVKLLRNKEIAFLLSSKTIIEMLQQLKLKITNMPNFQIIEDKIDNSIKLLEADLPKNFMKQRDVSKYLLQNRLIVDCRTI